MLNRPPAPSLPSAIAAQFIIHLRRSARLGPLGVAAGLVLLSALAGASLSRSSPDDWSLLPTFFSSFSLRVIALIALGFGTAAIRTDAEQGALASFMMRPRAALALPIARLLAVTWLLSIFALLAVGLLFGLATLIALPPETARLPWQLGAALGAALTYGAIFVFFGAISRHATALSLAYLVLIDMGLGNLSDRVALLSPYQSLSLIAQVAPDALLSTESVLGLWGALAQLFILAALATAGTIWRLRGDIPD